MAGKMCLDQREKGEKASSLARRAQPHSTENKNLIKRSFSGRLLFFLLNFSGKKNSSPFVSEMRSVKVVFVAVCAVKLPARMGFAREENLKGEKKMLGVALSNAEGKGILCFLTRYKKCKKKC